MASLDLCAPGTDNALSPGYPVSPGVAMVKADGPVTGGVAFWT